MMKRLRWEPIVLELVNPFHIAYGVSDTRTAYWVRLAGDEGWGEGTIPSYYGIPPEALTGYWDRTAERDDPLPETAAAIAEWVSADGPAPARCAVELALYDRLARRAGLPLWQFLGVPAPRPLVTSFTISIDTPERMAEMACKSAGYPVLKIKLGTEDDPARLAAVRQARPDALLRVDANAGWTAEEAVRRIRAMERFGLELVEQPVPKEDFAGMGDVQAQVGVPIMADESVQTLEDVEWLAVAGVQAINVKLMKVGGLTPAVRILRRAQELGLRVMLGCMIETSLGVTAMAHLSGLAEWADLDAPVLIANDPFQGIQYDAQGAISVPNRPGIGVYLKPQYAEAGV